MSEESPKPKKPQAQPLSHSSAETLSTCEQRYHYYKIQQAPQDPDYQKADSLSLGSAFHKVLEDSKHEKPASIRDELIKCTQDPDIQLPESDILLAHAMVLKYLRLHKQMGLKVLAVEVDIETKEVKGYVDAIMEDGDGKWWIVDMKTWKDLKPHAVVMLQKDPQAMLYASHAALIAEQLGLDLSKFGGCRWRVVTKSSAKLQSKETEAEYIMRLVEKHLSAYDIPIPFQESDASERLEAHLVMHKRTTKLLKEAPRRNYKACYNYFSPCPYWSRCYGKTYSEMATAWDAGVTSI